MPTEQEEWLFELLAIMSKAEERTNGMNDPLREGTAFKEALKELENHEVSS